MRDKQKGSIQTIFIITLFSSITIALICSAYLVLPDKLQPFTTDGCSAFPDSSILTKTRWKKCCTDHDFAYWQGGTYEQRLQADLTLERCVTELGEPEIAKLMLAGVRAGGNPYLPTSFRWGYGWKYPRFYKTLSNEDKHAIAVLTKKTL